LNAKNIFCHACQYQFRRTIVRKKAVVTVLALAMGCMPVIVLPATAQTQVSVRPPVPVKAPAASVTIQKIRVHGKSLEGNLEGNSPDREVWVALPPSYDKEATRRYPVIYALHGYSANPEKWFGGGLQQRIANAFADGSREMILVFPNAQTVHDGSMYSNSVTTGDWETFIAEDLVAYIDSHYRTIAMRDARGLMGHSMGGYGTARIGLKRPDAFSSLYVMSACCLPPRAITPEAGKMLEGVKTLAEATSGSFAVRGTLAASAAWSPNPAKPPFFVDLPTENGQVQPDILALWAANSPLRMVPQYVPNLRRYKAIAIDVGDMDRLKVDNQALHEELK
jgi:pimeloyl-ACP methyl ester carboxylesterase